MSRLTIGVLSVLLGCGSLHDTTSYALDKVRAAASEAFTCPPTRIVVRRLPSQEPPTCVAEIAPEAVRADPERLSLWNARQREKLDLCEEPVSFRVEACGNDAAYRCERGVRWRCSRIPLEDAR
jgi:hypothetical protein